VPYEYVAKRLPEPPDKNFTKGMTCIVIFCIFMYYPVFRTFVLLPYQDHWEFLQAYP
jgi:hypothetical protein